MTIFQQKDLAIKKIYFFVFISIFILYLWIATIFGYSDPDIAIRGAKIEDRFFEIGGFGNSFANLNISLFGYLAYVYLPLLLFPLYKLHDDMGYSSNKIRLTFAYISVFFSLLLLQSVIFDIGIIGNIIKNTLIDYAGISLGISLVLLIALIFFTTSIAIISSKTMPFIFIYMTKTFKIAFGNSGNGMASLLKRFLQKIKSLYADFNLDYIQRANKRMLNLEYSEVNTITTNNETFEIELIETPFDENTKHHLRDISVPSEEESQIRLKEGYANPNQRIDIGFKHIDFTHAPRTQSEASKENIEIYEKTMESSIDSTQSTENKSIFIPNINSLPSIEPKTINVSKDNISKDNSNNSLDGQIVLKTRENTESKMQEIKEIDIKEFSPPPAPKQEYGIRIKPKAENKENIDTNIFSSTDTCPINVSIKEAPSEILHHRESNIEESKENIEIKIQEIKETFEITESSQENQSNDIAPIENLENLNETYKDTKKIEEIQENTKNTQELHTAKEIEINQITETKEIELNIETEITQETQNQEICKEETIPQQINTNPMSTSFLETPYFPTNITLDSINTKYPQTNMPTMLNTDITMQENTEIHNNMEKTEEIQQQNHMESSTEQHDEIPTENISAKNDNESVKNHDEIENKITETTPPPYTTPPLGLLQKSISETNIDDQEIDNKINNLLSKLRVFKIKGDIKRVSSGPVVTTFEFCPEPDVKVNKVLGLQDDLAMALKAKSIRIQAPIPGKDVMGIEIPNNKVSTIYLRDVLESSHFANSSDNLTIALGKDIVGEPISANLATLPHLLVAGTTGSGKSVGVNAMILSLLYRNTPDELRLMMIDPKQVEFAPYEDLPHLITPIINSPAKAIQGLVAATMEMDKRYKIISDAKVKNISSYNQKAQEKMPYFVIIIDELADLIMTGGKDAEVPIARIAQMGRAAGMHLIIATQRSSTNIVTGTIKANLPSRISYRVGNRIDSKVILDDSGAERLLGNGDGLFTTSQGLKRIHAPWVSEAEIEQVVSFIKGQMGPQYDENFLNSDDKSKINAEKAFGESGGLIDEAKEIMIRDNKTSISYIQRKLGIGYNKAASIVETLEQEGFLSAPNSRGERSIL